MLEVQLEFMHRYSKRRIPFLGGRKSILIPRYAGKANLSNGLHAPNDGGTSNSTPTSSLAWGIRCSDFYALFLNATHMKSIREAIFTLLWA